MNTKTNAFAHAWRNPWFRLICFGIIFYFCYLFFSKISVIIINFAIAYLIAYIANPLLNKLERFKISRGMGVLFVLMLFMGVIGVGGALISTVIGQLIELIRSLPNIINNLESWGDKIIELLEKRGLHDLQDVKKNIVLNADTYLRNLASNIIPVLQTWLNPQGTLFSSIKSVGSILGQMLIITLMSVYMMLDYSRVNTAMIKIFPRPWQSYILNFAELSGTAIGGYVRGQFLIASFIGLTVGVGLSLINIPSAIAIGFLAGAFNIVPYLGPIIGAAPAILFALPSGGFKVFLVISIFIIANQVESSFLSPLVLSKTTDLHPLTVLLSIIIGGSLFGFLGALFAVPLVALVKLFIEKYYYSSAIYKKGP